jgi:hypothetical protein
MKHFLENLIGAICLMIILIGPFFIAHGITP